MMNEQMKKYLLPEFGDSLNLRLERAFIEHGKTFSEEAMNRVLSELGLFVLARIKSRWDRTGEPPMAVSINVQVL